MSNVQFDEQSYAPQPKKNHRRPSGIAGLIIKTGLAKTEKQANVVMIGTIVLLSIISFIALT